MADNGMDDSLAAAAVAVLKTAAPEDKTALSFATASAWRQGALDVGTAAPPRRPARPDRPALLAPRHMPRRRAAGTLQSRIALLHAVAHIELNAIDLAWDIIARFTPLDLPRASSTRGTTTSRAARSSAVFSAASHNPSWAAKSP